MTQTEPPRTNVLLTLVISLLTPMFLGVTEGDLTLARIAAAETINDYRAETRSDLIAIAQIIGFGLAALASLSQSMADETDIALALRLRGNANALNRSAEQNRRALAAAQRHPAPQSQDSPEYHPIDQIESILSAAGNHGLRLMQNAVRNAAVKPVHG